MALYGSLPHAASSSFYLLAMTHSELCSHVSIKWLQSLKLQVTKVSLLLMLVAARD